MTRLDFAVERQMKSHLCWAAIGCSIARFYSPSFEGSQERLVHDLFDEPCNRYYEPEKVLRHLGIFSNKTDRALEFHEVESEIQRGRVVVVRIRFYFGPGHLIAISGFSRGGEIWVEDPLYGNGPLPYDAVCNSYLGWGHWTHSYFTHRPHCFQR